MALSPSADASPLDGAVPEFVRARSVGSDELNEELQRFTSRELEQAAEEFKKQVTVNPARTVETSKTNRTLLVNSVVDDPGDAQGGKGKKKKGAFAGVFVPTCENMWGVLIFLRFYYIVGQAGVLQALLAVLLSFSCAFCTTSSMSATVSSGGVVSRGGPYYMISRALGPSVGASVGIMYWLAITMLCVLETLGAVEGMLMISDDLEFPACKQVYGSVLMIGLAMFVYGGINLVTKLGIFFVFVVFATLFMFYFGLVTAPNTPQGPEYLPTNDYVTGLSFETLKANWNSHYTDGASFGYVLSVFFPCFTGILSGANRADILRDPPKNLRQGTFGAIIFSLVMYSSYMILWGMVAKYPYLQGEHWPPGHDGGRRLAGAVSGSYVIEEVVWNPFPEAAKVGIIISSLSQALQCLVVAPRLLNGIAKDDILNILKPFAPMTSGEPKRALGGTYIIAALLVLIGNLDIVAPLLSMCFLVAYAFMNFSCFALTWLKSPAWRPKGIQRRRWRLWYLGTSFGGFVICLSIMFTIDVWWALVALILACCLYVFINWKLEAKGWGSAMDGIRYQLALTSLIQLEDSQKHHVNWRPQILILYKVKLTEELKGNKHHEILRFYSQLRKGNGFCVVACVLEAPNNDEHVTRKAQIEKDVIQSIMKEESIQGFAEVVVAPSWVEGTNYIIQLTGIGGLVPNTVLLDWPRNWHEHQHRAVDFVKVLRIALTQQKAVLAVRGLQDMPTEACFGTIDIWWMIHDGGFLILLSWLLVQHRTWRQCKLRVFTLAEGVSEEQAKSAAEYLTKTLRQRRLFNVNVEVILADDDMIEPYTYDWTLRVEQRHKFLEQLHNKRGPGPSSDAIPLAIDDLFEKGDLEREASKGRLTKDTKSDEDDETEDAPGAVHVTDVRTQSHKESAHSLDRKGPRRPSRLAPSFAGKPDLAAISETAPQLQGGGVLSSPGVAPPARGGGGQSTSPPTSPNQRPISAVMFDPSGLQQEEPMEELNLPEAEASPNIVSLDDYVAADKNEKKPDSEPTAAPQRKKERMSTFIHEGNLEAFQRLNALILSRSKRAQLVVMNLPDLWGTEPEEVLKYMTYCETLTKDLDRVMFVHSSGHEIFDLNH
eukprot:CAMPEP_0176042110 /NCGR_PEP_ID=MMETSP0120_2-20121206/20894_1 /TAXON_ID=160619 /ORGANISM="Kryptoperidinium foliaceum, Strain CCMP 1326" /LENGTH=1108 /DNA_ID=CAMNT_0017375521 /DNA_START=59 /DNA_END=3385 /DNA_ORIENTATION=-